MKALLIPAAIVTALVSIPAAHAEDGESSLRFFNKERAKAQAVGGYGNPLVAVPNAMAEKVSEMVDAMTGESQKAEAKPDAKKK